MSSVSERAAAMRSSALAAEARGGLSAELAAPAPLTSHSSNPSSLTHLTLDAASPPSCSASETASSS